MSKSHVNQNLRSGSVLHKQRVSRTVQPGIRAILKNLKQFSIDRVTTTENILKDSNCNWNKFKENRNQIGFLISTNTLMFPDTEKNDMGKQDETLAHAKSLRYEIILRLSIVWVDYRFDELLSVLHYIVPHIPQIPSRHRWMPEAHSYCERKFLNNVIEEGFTSEQFKSSSPVIVDQYSENSNNFFTKTIQLKFYVFYNAWGICISYSMTSNELLYR